MLVDRVLYNTKSKWVEASKPILVRYAIKDPKLYHDDLQSRWIIWIELIQLAIQRTIYRYSPNIWSMVLGNWSYARSIPISILMNEVLLLIDSNRAPFFFSFIPNQFKNILNIEFFFIFFSILTQEGLSKIDSKHKWNYKFWK